MNEKKGIDKLYGCSYFAINDPDLLKLKIAELEEELQNKADTNHQLVEQLAKVSEENAELKRDKEDLIFIRNQNAKCMCEDKERLIKAKEIIKRLLCVVKNHLHIADVSFNAVLNDAEKILKEE